MAVELLQQLQPPWDYGVTDDGRIFFINEEAGITTWIHPGRMHPIQSGYTTSSDLPRGWEKSVTPEGAPYYIDHINRRTTFYHPITNQSAAVNIPLDNQEVDHYHQDSPDSSKVSRRVIPVNKVLDSTPSSPKVPQSEVTLRGWLYKQERGPLKSWKRRWVVLSDYCLFYYKDRAQEQGQANGSILLPSYKVSPCMKEDNISRKYAFKFAPCYSHGAPAEHTNMRTYYFAAENESEMSQWIYHISLATNLQRDPSILAKNEHLREQNNNNVALSEGGFEDRSWMSPKDRHTPGADSDSNSFIEHPDAVHQLPPGLADHHSPYGHERQTSDLSEDVPWYTSPHDRSKNPYNEPPNHNPYPPPYDDRHDEYPQSGDPNSFKQAAYHDSFYSDRPPHMDSSYNAQQMSNDSMPQDDQRNGQFDPQSQYRSPNEQQYAPQDYRSPQDSFRSPEDSYRSPEDQYRSPEDPYRSPEDPYRSPQDSLRSPEYAHLQSPPGQYQSPHDSYRSDHEDHHDQHPPQDEPFRSYQMPDRSPMSSRHSNQQHYQSPEYLRPDQNMLQPPHSRQSSNASSQPPWTNPADSPYKFNSEKVAVLDTSLPRSAQNHSLDSSDGGNQSMVEAKNQRNIRNSMERGDHLPAALPAPLPAPLPGMRPVKRPGSVSSIDSVQRLRELQERMRNSPRPPGPPSDRQSFQDPNYHSQTPIYENLVASQGLTPEDGPTRPPLPAQYRDQIARDIAQSKTPTSRDDMLIAVDRERMRVTDPPVFQYPEPQVPSNAHQMDDLGPDGIESDVQQKIGQQQRYHPDGEDAEKTDNGFRGGPQSQRLDPYYTRPVNDTRGQDAGAQQHMGAPLSPSLSSKMQHGQPEPERHNISTIKEDPDMPDEDILDTKTLQELQSHLKDPRMRLSISAADLVGKSHEELVLLLIQLRRSQTRLQDVRNWYKSQLDVSREYEKEYKKQRHESIGRLNEALEEEHEHFQTLRKHNSQLEKQMDVNKPLVNLVDNLVTMGSLYGGENLLYAAEYKQIQEELYKARPGEIQPKRLIEFSRQHQEDKLQREQEEGIRQLTEDEANLEEKLQQLFELDRELQDQSFTVTSLQEDRELLEKALSGIRSQEDREDNGQVLRSLHHQRQTLQSELSKVRQQLADAFKLLEEKSAENARVEQEVVLLRKKIAQGLARNASSTANMEPDTRRARQQLEKEVTNIQSLMEGLSEQGAKISQAMRTIRHTGPDVPEQKVPSHYVLVTGRTYAETDLDNMETLDLANNQKIDLYKKSAPTEVRPNPQVVYDPTISPWTPDSYVVRTSLGLQQHIATRLPPTGAEHLQSYGDSGVPNGQGGQDSTYQKQYIGQDAAVRSSPNVSGSSVNQGSYGDRNQQQQYGSFSSQSQSPSALYENLVDTERYDPSPSRDTMSDQYSQQDIQEADENTKRFYGIIPRENKPKYTVRDVKKRESERKGRDKVKRLSNGDTGSDSEYPDYKNIPPAVSWNMERSQSFPHGIGLYEEPPPLRSHSSDFKTNTPPHMHAAQRRQVPKAKQEEKRLSATERLFPKKTLSQDGSDRIQRMSDIYSPKPYSGSSSSLNQSSGNRSNTQSPRDYGRVRSGPDFYRGSPATVATVRPVQNSQFSASQSAKGYGDQKLPNWGIPMLSTKERKPRRHQTISSSEPVKMEQLGRYSRSNRGDLLSSRLGSMAPEIVRSDTALDKEFDDFNFERDVLYMPQKVDIPERYVPEDDELLTEEEKFERAGKADRIRKMLAAHSLQEWAKDELDEASTDVHHKVEYEKRQRETILDIRGALAKEVTRKSRQIADRGSSFSKQRDFDTNLEMDFPLNNYDPASHFIPIA